jgi:two-component system chemotaxis sensor kinase CheA
LRNAIDHGIIKSGKIKIITKREKDYFTVEVVDSGQGINWKKVVAVAQKKSIINADTASRLSKELDSFIGNKPNDEIVNLIFHPNLSTAEKVTETSGRGIGLSVVDNFIRSIHGNMVVNSPLSKTGGTKFILELPLTLAIIKSLLVRIKDQRFAIPFTVIERAVLVANENIKSLGDQDMAVIEEINIPLIRIDRMFSFLYGVNKKEEIKLNKNLTIVLVRRGSELAGLVVDELISQQEIIVKPLPDYVRDNKGFAGSTILGDGQTILILDVLNIVTDIKKLIRV